MDLSSSYLGLALQSPLIASASPLTGDVAVIRRMEDAGVGAVVLPSLFEEQIRAEEQLVEAFTAESAESNPEATSYFPAAVTRSHGPSRYLDLVARARAAVDIPVIASLNGSTTAGWVDYARQIERAGASALELNIYRIVSDPQVSGTQAEADCVALVSAVRRCVAIPLSVKLHPHYSAFGAMARSLRLAGANGLVLFNRVYQPDIDLVGVRWSNTISLSRADEIRLGLLWVSELSGRLPGVSVAAGTGVESAEQIIKYLLAGADAVMTTSSLLRHGPEHVATLLDDLRSWLAASGFSSVAEIRGLLRREDHGAEARERTDYIESLTTYRLGSS